MHFLKSIQSVVTLMAPSSLSWVATEAPSVTRPHALHCRH